MSFSIKLYAVLDALDADGMASICHDDFIFVDDYEMFSKDDWIAKQKVLWREEKIDFARDRNTLLDQRDIFSFQFTRDIDGVPHRITNVSLLKDGKFWRSQIHRVPV